ncbi:MAG: formylglycine-generating enzyme family protein [Chloroflexi bacterium]|nr:formylglycine-generating enzyme family protein [Chloroflexota bacterium]
MISKSNIKVEKAKHPDMILIPEGDYIIGISDSQINHLVRTELWATEWYERDMFMIEQPQHKFHLKAFQLARTPVTNAEYYSFIWLTGYRVPREWIGFHYPDGQANHPVTGVSKIDAHAYIDWLNTQLNANYRLPTEAEWECAARGGDTRLYPWGEDFDPWRCNTVESGKRGTTAVGEYSPSGDSPFGVVDMAGNVWEWTCSLLKSYPYDPKDGREDDKGGGKFVIRGGSWYYSHKLARSTCRESALHNFSSPALGFRLAKDL